MTALISAALATAAVAGADYAALPLVVTVAARLGIIEPPPSMSFVESPIAIGAALALYLFSVVSNRFGRPSKLKAVERVVGIPFAMLSIAVVGLGAASRVGLGGHLLGPESSPEAWIETSEYHDSDVAILLSVSAVAMPLALVGKAVRVITSPLPFTKGLHTVMATFGVITSAIILQLPTEARVGLALAFLTVLVLFGYGVVRRFRVLLDWWRNGDAPAVQRSAAVAELVLPGAGAMIMRRPWLAAPRLILAVPMIVGFVLFGPVFIPVYLPYLFIGLGGALQVIALEVGDQGEPALQPARVTRGYAGRIRRPVIEDDW